MIGRLFLAASLALLVACGSTPQGKVDADQAQSMAAQERYAEAIAAIDRAIVKEPRNSSYKTIRAQFVSSFSTAVKRRVATELAAGPSKAALDGAEEAIAAATAAGVPAEEFSTISERVAQARQALIASLAGDYQAGVTAMNESR